LKPYFAQKELYRQFLRQHGLKKMFVDDELTHFAHEYNIKIKRPIYYWHVRHFEKTYFQLISMRQSDNFKCFRDTLQRVEYDLPNIYIRANAWAVGGLSTLKHTALTSRSDCDWNDGYAATHGLPVDESLRYEKFWIEYATKLLRKNHVVIAVLPLAALTKKNGVLTKFKSEGYMISTLKY
jgi:hypothetical protein